MTFLWSVLEKQNILTYLSIKQKKRGIISYFIILTLKFKLAKCHFGNVVLLGFGKRRKVQAKVKSKKLNLQSKSFQLVRSTPFSVSQGPSCSNNMVRAEQPVGV